jgi:hypothetical protein
MADKIQLEIEIDPDGNVRIHTHGLKGEDCLEETASLERVLGTVAERRKTTEYYARSAARAGTRTARG